MMKICDVGGLEAGGDGGGWWSPALCSGSPSGPCLGVLEWAAPMVGQGGLASWDSSGRKESDTTE